MQTMLRNQQCGIDAKAISLYTYMRFAIDVMFEMCFFSRTEFRKLIKTRQHVDKLEYSKIRI